MIALVESLNEPGIDEFRHSMRPIDVKLRVMNKSRNAALPERSSFVLSDEQLRDLLSHALDTRERIILELMGLSALRLAEVCTLEIARVDVKGRTVQVVGKGNKVRTIPISGGTADKLRIFLGKRTRGYVFPGRKGALHISERMVQYMVQQAGERIGFAQKAPTLKHLNPHTLRHTAARRMKARGFDYEDIARILGHNDVARAVMLYGTKTFKEIQDKADTNLFTL
jgi:integrase/recombinase XerC